MLQLASELQDLSELCLQTVVVLLSHLGDDHPHLLVVVGWLVIVGSLGGESLHLRGPFVSLFFLLLHNLLLQSLINLVETHFKLRIFSL